MKKNDNIGRTFLVILILCLVCSVIVAGAAVGLQPLQEEQKQLDKQRNILSVANIGDGKMNRRQIQQLFVDRIEPRLLDLQNGEFVTGSTVSFDMNRALKDPQVSTALDSAQDVAGIKRRSNQVEVYLVKDGQGEVKQVILPVYGSGLWSVMHAFVALDNDGNTIKGLTFYDQGETPGLGGEIANPAWCSQWIDKKLFNDEGKFALKIVKGGASPQDFHGVDGISGATLTMKGVQNTFEFWMGQQGYGPFLKRVREGVLKNG